MYPQIRLFGVVTIPTYMLSFIAGLALSVLFAMRLAKKDGKDRYDVLYAAIYMVIGIGIGAKLFFFLSRVPNIIRNFDIYKALWKLNKLEALNYLFGGLVFYGGLIGALLGIIIYCRQYKVELEPLIRIIAPFIPFAHAFGRIGCFLGGCCYGIAYDGPLACHFDYNPLSPHLNEAPRFPVQLLEALLNFICSGVLYILYKKTRLSGRKLVAIYLIYYTIARFFLEYLRGDIERGHVGLLSTSQIISIVLLPVALIMLFIPEKTA